MTDNKEAAAPGVQHVHFSHDEVRFLRGLRHLPLEERAIAVTNFTLAREQDRLMALGQSEEADEMLQSKNEIVEGLLDLHARHCEKMEAEVQQLQAMGRIPTSIYVDKDGNLARRQDQTQPERSASSVDRAGQGPSGCASTARAVGEAEAETKNVVEGKPGDNSTA